jgi:sulfur carrier protein ThiS
MSLAHVTIKYRDKEVKRLSGTVRDILGDDALLDHLDVPPTYSKVIVLVNASRVPNDFVLRNGDTVELVCEPAPIVDDAPAVSKSARNLTFVVGYVCGLISAYILWYVIFNAS